MCWVMIDSDKVGCRGTSGCSSVLGKSFSYVGGKALPSSTCQCCCNQHATGTAVDCGTWRHGPTLWQMVPV
jgi:hypothetical protein